MAPQTTSAQVSVWLAMAEHFLDTETRHCIPETALRCLQAGYHLERARFVWREEVAPAVSFNLWLVAGEWCGWDEAWLVSSIAKRRKLRTSWLSYPLYRLRVNGLHQVWLAVERCIEALSEVSVSERELHTQDLTFLARHYFDFTTQVVPLAPQEGQRLRTRLSSFFHIMTPATLPAERELGRLRVERALSDATLLMAAQKC